MRSRPLILFVILICGLIRTITVAGEPPQNDFFRQIDNPFEVAIEGGSNNPASPNTRFWTFNAQENPETIGKKHQIVFESAPQVFGEQITLAIQSTQFIHQFKIELVDKSDPTQTKQLLIKPTPIITDWQLASWNIPKKLQSKPFIIRVTNIKKIAPTSIFGISDPGSESEFYTMPNGTMILFEGVFQTVLNLLVALVTFGFLITPSVVLLAALRLKSLPELCLLPLSIVIASLTGYALFWVYYLNSDAGISGSILLYLIPILTVGSSSRVRTGVIDIFKKVDFLYPLLLLLLSYLISTSAGFLYGGWETPNQTASVRYLANTLPGDNTLPYILSERLYNGLPLQPFFNDWLASDRPPLQAGMVLLTRIFALNPETQYHITSAILQCLLIPAAYIFSRSRQLPVLTSSLVSLSLVFSSFFLLNSFFVWPKLLPVAFMLLNTSLIFEPKQILGNQNERLRCLLIGTFTTLAFLAHGGSFFGLLPLYIVAFTFRKLPPMRYWGWIILPFIIGMLPWTLFQKLADPPGNRLVMWHLAGSHATTENPLLIIFSKNWALGWESWKANKIQSLHMIWGNWSIAFIHFFPLQVSNSYQFLRTGMFLSTALSLLPQLIVLPLLPILLMLKKAWGNLKSHTIDSLVFSMGILIWTVMIYGPGKTILHHGTYYLPILAMLSVAIALCRINQWITVIFFSLSWAFTSIVWVFPSLSVNFNENWITNIETYNLTNLILYLLCSGYFLYLLWASLKEPLHAKAERS